MTAGGGVAAGSDPAGLLPEADQNSSSLNFHPIRILPVGHRGLSGPAPPAKMEIRSSLLHFFCSSVLGASGF